MGAMIRAGIRVDRRLAGGLGAPMAACSGCDDRNGGRGHNKRRSRTGMARVGEDVQLAGRRVSGGREPSGWQGGMARSRARARLNWASHGQRWGRCRVRRRAERVSRPAREKNRRRRVLVVASFSPRPMRAAQRARLWAITCTASQAPFGKLRIGGEAARGEMIQPHAVLEVPDGVLDLGVAAMVGLQFQGVSLPVVDEAVIAAGGEEGQLGTGRGLHPPDVSRTGAAPGSVWNGVQAVSATSAAPSIQ